jgi:hypothetical protein
VSLYGYVLPAAGALCGLGTLLAIVIALLALTTTARAIVIETGGDLTNYVCSITKSKTSPGEKPINFIVITVVYEEPVSIHVVHVEVMGKQHERNKQYTNIRHTERKGEITWTGTWAGITSVVWCSGFRYDFAWVKLPILNDSGEPLHERGVTQYPGLYFLGLRRTYALSSALLAGVGNDAAFIADHIVARQ